MADAENLDDEFFADLYNDDEPAPTTAVKPVAEEPASDTPRRDAHAPTHTQNGNGTATAAHDDEEEDEEDDSDDEIDFNLGNTATHVPSAGMPMQQDSPARSLTPVPPVHQAPQSHAHGNHGGQGGHGGHGGRHQNHQALSEDG